MAESYRITINKPGGDVSTPDIGDIVNFQDVDMSVTASNPARVAALRYAEGVLDVIVIYLPGRKYWSSLGSPFAYAPAEYKVFNVLPGGDGEYFITQVIDFPVRMPSQQDIDRPIDQIRRRMR